MKYIIAVLLVILPTIAVLLGTFHWLILPYVGPHGFLPMMVATTVFGLSMGYLAERGIDWMYARLMGELA